MNIDTPSPPPLVCSHSAKGKVCTYTVQLVTYPVHVERVVSLPRGTRSARHHKYVQAKGPKRRGSQQVFDLHTLTKVTCSCSCESSSSTSFIWTLGSDQGIQKFTTTNRGLHNDSESSHTHTHTHTHTHVRITRKHARTQVSFTHDLGHIQSLFTAIRINTYSDRLSINAVNSSCVWGHFTFAILSEARAWL